MQLYDSWSILDKVKTIHINNVVLYKRCLLQCDNQQYQTFINDKLPHTSIIISDEDELFMKLRRLRAKSTEHAVKSLKERVNLYLNLWKYDEFDEAMYEEIADRSLALITQ